MPLQKGLTIFQTFDWCYGWCEKFLADGTEKEVDTPQVYALFCEEKMVMVWPMVRTPFALWPVFS